MIVSLPVRVEAGEGMGDAADIRHQLLRQSGRNPSREMHIGGIGDAAEPRWAERRLADTQAALDRGVFGAPSYVIGDEIFWGQDRLAFVERRLARG